MWRSSRSMTTISTASPYARRRRFAVSVPPVPAPRMTILATPPPSPARTAITSVIVRAPAGVRRTPCALNPERQPPPGPGGARAAGRGGDAGGSGGDHRSLARLGAAPLTLGERCQQAEGQHAEADAGEQQGDAHDDREGG